VADAPSGPPTLILASASPRRLELLARLGISPVIRPADLDETPLPGEDARSLVTRLSAAKAQRSASLGTSGRDEVVLAADTEVALDGRPLGKPADGDDARRMLRSLAGRTHEVVTGVGVRRGERTWQAVAVTAVTFRHLTEAELGWYLASGEPEGKAGAYALQGAGAALVERIEGSDTNVIGLPLAETVELLRRAGLDLLAERP
jgi:septum formation protein